MALRLSLRAPSQVPIEVEGLVPAATRGKPLAEIERWPIWHGNQQLPLAELFRASGNSDDGRLEFCGDTSGVHWIGARMQEGFVHVEGAAGRHTGSAMTGGDIHVAGDAGDWLGCEMRGGLLHVRGSAGDFAAAAYPGSPQGMNGGTVLVTGNVGAEAAHSMRRGLLAVGGSAGAFAAINMGAGSMIVGGECGPRPAAGMRRGTLVVLGARPALLPTFRSAGPCRPLFLRCLLRSIARHGFALPAGAVEATYELFHGDLVATGRGEILWRHS